MNVKICAKCPGMLAAVMLCVILFVSLNVSPRSTRTFNN
jgi:hypothetical protein